jgi:hypothetical protein
MIFYWLQYDFGTYFATPPPGQQSTPLPLIGATRDLLERVLRRRVLETSNVRLQSGAVATGLVWSPDKSQIHGKSRPHSYSTMPFLKAVSFPPSLGDAVAFAT